MVNPLLMQTVAGDAPGETLTLPYVAVDLITLANGVDLDGISTVIRREDVMNSVGVLRSR